MSKPLVPVYHEETGNYAQVSRKAYQQVYQHQGWVELPTDLDLRQARAAQLEEEVEEDSDVQDPEPSTDSSVEPATVDPVTPTGSGTDHGKTRTPKSG